MQKPKKNLQGDYLTKTEGSLISEWPFWYLKMAKKFENVQQLLISLRLETERFSVLYLLSTTIVDV